MTRLEGLRVLEIGCGRSKLPGAVGLDRQQYPGVDVISDLNCQLPFKDSEFEVVYSNQVLEHVSNFLPLIEECHRILMPGGLLIAHVPYFRSSWAAIDPTHVRQFTINSMNYFVQGTYEHENYRFSEKSFESIKTYIDSNYPRSPFRFLFTAIARRWPNRFENSVLSFLYPFNSLIFELKKSGSSQD